MVMKLTLAEPRYLKDSISIISELVNEARFKITPQAIELVAMDPANVAMVIFKLLSSCFIEYDVKDTVQIAINISNMKQIMKRAKPTDTLTLEMGEGTLKIQLKGSTTRTFSLPIIDLEEKEQRVPQLNFSTSIDTEASVLNEAIEDVDIVGESVSFSAKPDTFTIHAEGDLSHANIEMKNGKETKISMKHKEEVKAKYSVEYLKKMMNGSKLAERVIINFDKDYPLKLDYVSIDKVFLSFILAPRVEND
jgi:proliferating cell nuclear antigen